VAVASDCQLRRHYARLRPSEPEQKARKPKLGNDLNVTAG